MGPAGYFILEHGDELPPIKAPETDALRPRGGGGFKYEGFGPKPFGPSPPPPPPPAPPPRAVKIVTADLTPAEAATERKREGVRMVGRKMPIRLIAPMGEASSPPGLPADNIAWGVRATGADTSSFDGTGVTIAVLDTGIKRGHKAFKGHQLVTNETVKDFTTDDGDGSDEHGHGSHCAGTIVGRDVKGVRIGIARGAKLLVGKVLPDDVPGDSSMLFDALNWASREGANIVSMSLGFDFPAMVEQLKGEGFPEPLAVSNALVTFGQNLRAFDALMASFRAGEPFGRNMLVIAAAGNESRHDAEENYRISASLPAAAAGVISVAAFGRNGPAFSIAPFSNTDVLIAAPGVDILSANITGGELTEMSGTSQACPHVAGLAALWWQKIEATGETPTPAMVIEQMFTQAGTATDFTPPADGAARGRGRALAPQN